jgi:hypothetical protein
MIHPRSSTAGNSRNVEENRVDHGFQNWAPALLQRIPPAIVSTMERMLVDIAGKWQGQREAVTSSVPVLKGS